MAAQTKDANPDRNPSRRGEMRLPIAYGRSSGEALTPTRVSHDARVV
jgi:hypothetical protein